MMLMELHVAKLPTVCAFICVSGLDVLVFVSILIGTLGAFLSKIDLSSMKKQ